MNLKMITATKPMCMATRSGRNFNPLSPCAEDVLIDDIAHALAFQCRFNGHTREFYSVAQHSVMVAGLVPKHLWMDALLHDAAEAYLGDVVTPVKAAIPDFEKMEARVIAAINHRFGLSTELSAHDRYLIKRADLIALATEKRDLMPNARGEWECLGDAVAHPSLIAPLQPLAAKEAFLLAFSRFSRESRELLVEAA